LCSIVLLKLAFNYFGDMYDGGAFVGPPFLPLFFAMKLFFFFFFPACLLAYLLVDTPVKLPYY